jgi:hypothetical protein
MESGNGFFFLLKHAEKRDGARANEGERVK